MQGNSEETPIEALEPVADFLIRQAAAVHPEGWRVADSTWRMAGRPALGAPQGTDQYRHLMRLSGTLAGGVEDRQEAQPSSTRRQRIRRFHEKAATLG